MGTKPIPLSENSSNSPTREGCAATVVPINVEDSTVVSNASRITSKKDLYSAISADMDRNSEKSEDGSIGTSHKSVEEKPLLKKNSPPWVISLIFHAVLLLVLALIFLPAMLIPNMEFTLTIDDTEEEVEDVWAEDLGEQVEFDSNLVQQFAQDTPQLVLSEMNVPEPMAAPVFEPVFSDTATESASDFQVPTGNLLSGRNPGGRSGLCGKYGGTKKTENSVEKGLLWLKKQQLKNGSWSLIGPYSSGAENENQEAATAMALLAFQGAGNTTDVGKYKDTVKRGWNWLLKQQAENGNFFSEGPRNHSFYTHAQASIAICELYAMTQDEKYREPARKATEYLIHSQSPEGGWRYEPCADSDLSVTGWCVMALQSAKMAGLEVPQKTLDRIMSYLDVMGAVHGQMRYPYLRGGATTRVMTAEAILCRQYLGWKQDDPRMENALDYVISNPISYDVGRDVYYWYYATQACHHKEGKWWKLWNDVMREEVPKQQLRTGKEAGSWDARSPSRDAQEAHGGRLYVTCLSIYMLEVYYRHLPIYSSAFGKDRASATSSTPDEQVLSPDTPHQPDAADTESAESQFLKKEKEAGVMEYESM